MPYVYFNISKPSNMTVYFTAICRDIDNRVFTGKFYFFFGYFLGTSVVFAFIRTYNSNFFPSQTGLTLFNILGIVEDELIISLKNGLIQSNTVYSCYMFAKVFNGSRNSTSARSRDIEVMTKASAGRFLLLIIN